MKSDPFPALFRRRMAEAVIADRSHPFGKDMPKVAFNEFEAGQGFRFLMAAVVPVYPSESDALLIDCDDPGIGDGGATNVVTEVFDRVGSVAERLDLDAPVLVPDGGIHLPLTLTESLVKMCPEGLSEERKVDEKVGLSHGNDIPLGIDSGSGNDVMNVRVKEKALIPGVKHAGKTGLSGPQVPVGGQLFSQSAG